MGVFQITVGWRQALYQFPPLSPRAPASQVSFLQNSKFFFYSAILVQTAASRASKQGGQKTCFLAPIRQLKKGIYVLSYNLKSKLFEVYAYLFFILIQNKKRWTTSEKNCARSSFKIKYANFIRSSCSIP